MNLLGTGYGYYDPTMLLMLPAMLFSMYAQWKVSSAMAHSQNIANHRGMTGFDAARYLLDRQGLYQVQVEETTRGDHYDPTKKVVRLSPNVGRGSSLTSLGVAAHEVGHAVQHSQAYAPLAFRTGFFPVANFGTMASWPLIIFGLMLSMPMLINIGIVVFCGVVVFQIITLPVEYNASARALQMLSSQGLLSSDEEKSVKSVLSAAALTYVAAAAAAIFTLLRYFLLAQNSRRRR